MDTQQTKTEHYLRRIHELIAAYNDKNENGGEAEEEESIALLAEARTLVREALHLDQSNDELVQLHIELVIVLSRYFFARALASESYTQSLIEPGEFVKRWGQSEDGGDHLVRLDAEATAKWNIGPDSAQFLNEAGLPESAAPFLSFGEAGRLWEMWNFEADVEYARELFRPYIQIGFDGSGNPLCLDEEYNGIVVRLDHDFGFQAITFVNSSVQQLAECLLVYRVAFEELQRSDSDEAGDGRVQTEIAEWMQQECMRIDSRAMSRECFWSNEVAFLRATAGE